jgi:pyruvate/2-oxoglutarate dehydrogenase complex dihydrolipoamide acyltransferase (E2) component
VEFKQPFKTVGAFGTTVAAGLIGSLAFAVPAQAQTATIDINPDHLGRTAGYFEKGCGEDSQLPDDQGANEDGWVFVLPQGDVFVDVTAVFADLNGDEHTLEAEVVTTGNSGNTKHAFVITPAGWTLVDASADIEGPSSFFNVTHTCPGEPGEGETSPDGEPSTPGEEPSEPGEESSPVCEEPTEPEASATTEPSTPAESSAPAESDTPCEETTSPAGNGNLPTTGTPLTIALVSAAVLAAGGAALFMIQRRRREAQNW